MWVITGISTVWEVSVIRASFVIWVIQVNKKIGNNCVMSVMRVMSVTIMRVFSEIGFFR